MNATSAGDGCPIPGTGIPGPRRPGSRMKRVHTTTKKNPQQGDNPHDSPEPTEDPTTPKAKRVCPTFRAENLQTDEDNCETDETPSIPNLLFSSSTTPSSDSIQQMGKLRKLLKEALTLASALNNIPSSPVHWDQTTLWLTECIFQTVNADFHETQQARHNEIIESMAKLTADVETIKNANTQPHKQVTLSPTREGTEANNHNLSKPATYAQAAAKLNNHNQETNLSKTNHPTQLIISFENGVPANKRCDPIIIINNINKFLAENIKAQHLKITAIRWNSQGNCILYTRSDQ